MTKDRTWTPTQEKVLIEGHAERYIERPPTELVRQRTGEKVLNRGRVSDTTIGDLLICYNTRARYL
jgi:hypothetical protein